MFTVSADSLLGMGPLEVKLTLFTETVVARTREGTISTAIRLPRYVYFLRFTFTYTSTQVLMVSFVWYNHYMGLE